MSRIPNIPLNARGGDSERNRAYDTRRDNDDFRTPSVTLYDIDYAIFHYLNNTIVPNIEENGEMVSVPILFANGQTAVQIQRHNYLFDNEQKTITPILLIERTTVDKDDRIPTVEIPIDMFKNGPIYFPKKQHNNRNDRIEATYNTKQSYEYYVSVFPKHVLINYSINIWTEKQSQMNDIIQAILLHNKKLWGSTYKFTTTVNAFDLETVNTITDQRLVRSNSTLDVNGILQDEFLGRESTVRKAFTTKRVDFENERSQPELYIDNRPKEIRPSKSYLDKLKNID